MTAHDQLKTLLEEDIRQLDELAALLLQEKGVLSSPNIQPLQDITALKNGLLEGVRERAKKKIHLLVSIGYNPKAGEPSRFIRAGGMDSLHQLWKEAETQLRNCQAINQNNGRVLGHLQQRLSRLTDIFRGASGQQKLYGAKGQQTSVSSTNILASA
ncbi:flagellar protein FlgN [Marinobacter daepoensis]|uniref:flagella synthesis protein FlgN n=1 Tax=Marinobacter daepoensis TaxID=262077 RepID=UPI001C97A21C|nr:flagellar protein FlgN [Marinobacter daepoensis]MBY6032140.1 flagellar protein FlgN [Marinobacter daepoensis]